jgi:hypothetical protein
MPNGDIAASAMAQQLFQGNRAIWNSAKSWGDMTAVGLAAVSGTATAAIASAEAPALLNALIGRNVPGSLRISSGILNSNPFLRIGLGWQEGVGNVFRISLGSSALGGTVHLINQAWPFPLYSWPPTIVP